MPPPPRVLQLCDAKARHGRFDTLEAFLCKRRIPIDLRTEGRFDRAPELVSYRPEGERWGYVTDAGDFVAPVEPLRELSAALERFCRREPRFRVPRCARNWIA